MSLFGFSVGLLIQKIYFTEMGRLDQTHEFSIIPIYTQTE